jgi:hypothetical protein
LLPLAGAVFVLAVSDAAAQGNVSTQECCLPLLFPLTARAVSLGQAVTARANPDGLFFNPASIVGKGEDHFLIHHESTFGGQNNAFSLIIDAGVLGAFGVTYVLIDQGEVEATDDFGNVIGSIALRSQQLLASYATNVVNGLRAGVSYKLYNSSTDVSATTHLIDLGLQYRPRRIPSLELGVALLHYGLALQLKNAEQADPTPARLRIGAAYEVAQHFRPDSSIAFTISADLLARARSAGSPVAAFGAEVAFDQTLFVRGGYAASGDALTKGGAGIGLGIRYQRFTVAVAKSFSRSAETEGDPFQVTFGITF